MGILPWLCLIAKAYFWFYLGFVLKYMGQIIVDLQGVFVCVCLFIRCQYAMWFFFPAPMWKVQSSVPTGFVTSKTPDFPFYHGFVMGLSWFTYHHFPPAETSNANVRGIDVRSCQPGPAICSAVLWRKDRMPVQGDDVALCFWLFLWSGNMIWKDVSQISLY